MKKIIFSALMLVLVLGVCSAIYSVPFSKKRERCTTAYACSIEQNSAFYSENKQYQKMSKTTIGISNSSDIYNLLTPELITFYETYFAKEKIITDLKPQKLARMTDTYDVSKNKMYALIIVQNISSKNKQKMTLTALSEKSDSELVRYGKEQFTIYIDSLSEDEKQLLAEKFGELKKTYKMPNV